MKHITQPSVWRRLLVPSYFNFLHLHAAIQIYFGWTDSHLFMFSEKGYRSNEVITTVNETDDAGFTRQTEAEEMKLSEVFKQEKQTYIYIYDFGDSWEHLITLEKIIPEISKSPQLLAGKGACPPEDCGGPGGYIVLKKVLADKSHPEYKEYILWMGKDEDESFDPTHCDLDDAQQALADVFESDG